MTGCDVARGALRHRPAGRIEDHDTTAARIREETGEKKIFSIASRENPGTR
jgi:hypothetical protein